MSCADDDDEPEDQCEFWDDDGCYCVCGAMCSCEPFHPSRRPIVDTGDELHQILGEALNQSKDIKFEDK